MPTMSKMEVKTNTYTMPATEHFTVKTNESELKLLCIFAMKSGELFSESIGKEILPYT